MLGQVKVAGKSNEIVAFKLLNMLAIRRSEGPIVTIDAMAVAQRNHDADIR
jgi:predicted transposase YbfD/YdcC